MRILSSPRRAFAAALPLLALAAACDANPAAPVNAPPATPTLERLDCSVNVRGGEMACASGAAGGPSRTLLTLGGQARYIRLSNGAVTYDAGTDELSTTVYVQNLLAGAMGTANGTTPATTGVRVFFVAGPTGGAAVANASGTESFTAPDQPYFEYDDDATDEVAAKELGGDGILSPGEITAGKVWRFKANGAASFTFAVYVQAQVPQAEGAFLRLRSLAANGTNSCGLTAEGAAFCWGSNDAGQLGDGTYLNRLTPSPVAMPAGVAFDTLIAGGDHTCGLTAAGQAYCWGLNVFGEVGDGSSGGIHGVPVAVAQPAGVAFTTLAAGKNHTCALTAGGAAYCWGRNDYGQAGDGSKAHRATPGAVSMPANAAFTSITAGRYHTCATSSGGQSYCWGEGGSGQMGNQGYTGSLVPTPVLQPAGVGFTRVRAGLDFTCALTSAGQAYCWGTNVRGQLGNNLEYDAYRPVAVHQAAGVAFTGITAGDEHACGVTTAGQAYCWGFAFYGQLGDGTNPASRPVPGPVTQPAGTAFRTVVSGGGHVCAQTVSGATMCWGENRQGQLGDGTTTRRYAPVYVAGTH
ncbi:MAG TPA: hypothetical protein VF665_01225 [Longimicrobium sp.]|jgi:alpha-tubulin suppressor-like RCC1 family protein|uniref:RCC1 domain-containing protein n=1 Tax=Longimicrobium sp. TaxID=2029185 RepID=UPI002EDB4630